MLRMLAFRPDDGGMPAPRAEKPVATAPSPAAAPQRAAASAPPTRPAPVVQQQAEVRPAPPVARAEPTPAPVAAAPIATDSQGLPHWESLIERANLRGPFGLLAQNALLRERDGNTLVLALQPAHMSLAVEPMVSQMEERIGQALGERIRLRFVSIAAGVTVETPAARAAQARDTAQSEAEQSIEGDPLVQSLKREFGARVVPQSVKPFSQIP